VHFSNILLSVPHVVHLALSCSLFSIHVSLLCGCPWYVSSFFYRLSPLPSQIAALRRGINKVVPAQTLSLFTWQELELMICGKPHIDIELLKRHTKYSGVQADDAHIGYFWSVLEGFSQEARRAFVRFAWAQVWCLRMCGNQHTGLTI
jgi:hypothetical protein